MVSEYMYDLGTRKSPIGTFVAIGRQKEQELGAENIFNFGLGAPAVPMPEEYREELIRLLKEEDQVKLHTYTMGGGVPTAREAIAADLNRRFNAKAAAGDIFMTVGAAPALCAVINAIRNSEEEEIVLLAPYFSEYVAFIKGARMKYTEVRTLEPDFRLDLDAVKAAITPNTAALIINSPNNPSGAIYPPEDLKSLGEILTEKSREFSRTIYLISDEPYREVLLDDVEVPFMANFYDNTIVCYSYSKSLSIAGERMGYILVPKANEDHDRLLTAIGGASKALGVSNAPSLFQYALIKCAGKHSDVELYRKNRAVLYKALTEMGYECTWPKGTFYMMVKTLEEDWAFCRRAAEMGLILVPCSGFGFPGYVRVALCVSEDTAVRSIPAFRKLLESYK